MAKNYGSPGVRVTENDLTERVPNIATASAAIVGYSAKGDVDNIVLITNTQQFIQEYGKPDATSGKYFHYSALAYLAQGTQLYCLRVVNGALYGGINIMHADSEESNVAFTSGVSSVSFSAPSGLSTDVVFQIFGKDPGVWNDKIAVKISDVKDGTETEPTEQYTFVISVYYQNDDGNYELVEKWKVSRKQKKDGYGKDLYLETKINDISKYIKVADSSLADTVLPAAQATTLATDGGSDGSAISSSDVVTGWDEFTNKAVADVRILINGGETDVATQTKMKSVAETRLDCEAFLDMPYDSLNSVTDMVTFRTTTQNFNSSYCCLFTGWVKIYDTYNDKIMEVPPSGFAAARRVYADYVGHPWDAMAGDPNGLLDNVIGVTNTFSSQEDGDLDTLYENGINPIVKFPSQGIMLWGQKTQQYKASALDRENVRHSLNIIKNEVEIALRPFIFKSNTETTRFRIESLLNEYFDGLSAQGAFQTEGDDNGYYVLCDETNNISNVIDNNEIHVDIFVKPVRIAEFIQVQLVVTPTGIVFKELIDRGLQF